MAIVTIHEEEDDTGLWTSMGHRSILETKLSRPGDSLGFSVKQ